MRLLTTMARLGCAAATLFALGTAQGAEWVVKIKSQVSFADGFNALATGSHFLVKDQHPQGKLLLVEGDRQTIERIHEVEYVVPNVIFHTFDAPNDPNYSKQWALPKINAENAWIVERGSEGVVVAVIDTGVDWTHEDLKEQIWANPKETAGNSIDDDGNGLVDDIRGWDFRDNDANPMDETGANPGHGTHCAGIIGGRGNNGIGISGIAQRVSMLPIRFLGADGSGDLMTAAKAIDYATTSGANVISASWGAKVPRAQVTPILEAIERARDKGILFVVAAANDGASNDNVEVYPANAGFTNVISVAASDEQDAKPSWSNFGRANVDIAAPGANILSTLPGNRYGNLSGTSMATPLVAGLSSLIIAQAKADNRTLKPEDVKAILQATGDKSQIQTACQCRINAGNALKNVRDNALTIVPNAGTVKPNTQKKFAAIGGAEPYKFASSAADVATVTTDGNLSAVKEGQTVLTVEDNGGTQATSRDIFVAHASEGGGGGQCPLPDPQMCQIMCQIFPQLPWCSK